tara:strand:- start:523 stop:1491 length:969 start_codon:yes stop_codon:yes gene_type:complete
MKKHITVTGGAGFIAYHLIQKLIKDGYKVSAFDNYNDYYDPDLKHKRAYELMDLVNVDVVNCDLKQENDLTDLICDLKPDAIIHLAAYAGVRHSLSEPQTYIDNNITGTQNLINACAKASVQHVIYASTSCTMAGNELPWNEDEKTGYQLNPYGYSKSANENQMMSSEINFTTGLRFFTVYGPWGRPDMALFDFTKNIIAGNPIQLFNYGDMIRDFTYVDDIVQGIGLVLKDSFDRDSEYAFDEIYNIGYGDQVKLVDFVTEIEKNLGRKAITELIPMHPADTHTTWSDTTKLQKLGYDPKVPIAEGVKNFVNWYKDYYKVN